ncbi:MAG: hypothetical protein HZRFUVUK_000755 [Candidatus Fervidibacterota bacterium]|jgi:MFS family permease
MHKWENFRDVVKGIPKPVKALSLVSLLNDASSEMIYPLLPLFLRQELGASFVFIGLLEGIAETTASLLKLASGWLSDMIGRHKLLVFVGYALACLTRPIMAFVNAAWQVLFLRFVDRVGKGVRTSPRDALIASISPENMLGASFGFQRALDHVGALIGPLLASAVLRFTPKNYRLVFLLASIPAIASLFVLWFGVSAGDARRIKHHSQSTKISLTKFEARFRWFLLATLIFTLSNSSDAFLLLRAGECNVPSYLIPALWTWLHIIKSVSSMPGGALSDYLGRVNVLAFGWLIYACAYAGFGFASSPLHIWLLFTIYGLYFGMVEGTERALVADLTQQEMRGSGYGAFHFIVGVGMFPASFLFGLLLNKFGAPVAFSIYALLSFIAALTLLVKVR